MTQPVAVPFWLLLLILAFAAITLASHFLFPSVRWFFRKRAEKALARLNKRLDRPIEFFKLARRQDMIVRLSYDLRVLEAVADHAAETGVPGSVAFQEARRYAREIVPGFSATLYFGVAIRFARWLSRLAYRVRIGKVDAALAHIDPKATVIFVMNHRSNMDYVLITWLVANRSAISYAVGEWARIWPLSALIRSMGAYFIRRGSRNTLYRRVLARYVQMATAQGTTQAIFPEGGLSLDGRVGAAKMGLLSYIVSAYEPGGRDVVFVPVGLAYDRVLEDRILTDAALAGSRRFRGKPLATIKFILRNISRKFRGRFKGFGTTAAGFGPPVSLRRFLCDAPDAPTEELGAHLMAEIIKVVPVLPVPLVAAALTQNPADRAALLEGMIALQARLNAHGAVLKLSPKGVQATLDEGLEPLLHRRLIDENLAITAGSATLIAFYAASVLQRLE
ncbi:1-acyl-sn-glycerol-3-phosphate acyltransferase [Cypionkella sp.]|uniref:1-acyl-sn-glycerol-3-phosphate acyltransferase n=1 Tax=Cypionkella sp. TaxID=2811411 RepID=UPI002615B69A|nr:1-acyl-sn-glycerol-3-phosphate acyltransferase [Cypionkella sp.]MDB5664667.1 glycerol-3-phosphate acyltransferase [Cypionkella sp.]